MENIKRQIKAAFLFIVMVSILSACMNDFLDIKRDKSQVIPVTLEDFRSLLDNQTMNSAYPILGEIGSDEYYISTQQWQGLSDPIQKNAYIWADDVFQGESSADWNQAYGRIIYANFVMEGISNIVETSSNKLLRDELIGAAHFFRGTNLFLLAQLFCKQYDAQTANEDLGLPLRTTSNINVNYQRATLADTYSQIISDLEQAERLLPLTMSLNTKPYRGAALGMLANVYLQMGDFQSAFNYADMAFSLAPQILDYNVINTSLNVPFPQFGQGNEEIIFYSQLPNAAIIANARLNVDSVLFNSYDEHDLRKQAFFFLNGGRNAFKGNYSGIAAIRFSGITTPEILLIRAECNVRLGNVEDSVQDLNRLLINRYRPENFIPIGNEISQSDLLESVILERQKELVYRGRRWHDLKRFSKDPNLAKELKRILDEDEFTLPINSPKWVWPIPPDVISLGGIEQNQR